MHTLEGMPVDRESEASNSSKAARGSNNTAVHKGSGGGTTQTKQRNYSACSEGGLSFLVSYTRQQRQKLRFCEPKIM